MLSKKDNRNMKIIAGLAIIYIWSIFVGLPTISGTITTIELLLVFSIIPTFITVLWFILVFYKDDKEEEEK